MFTWRSIAILLCLHVILLSKVNVVVYIRNRNKSYRPFVVNVTLNVCHALAKQKGQWPGKVFIRVLNKFTNINHSCPYTGAVIAKDLYIEPNLLPLAIIPRKSFKVSVTFMEGFPYDYMGVIDFYGDIVEEM